MSAPQKLVLENLKNQLEQNNGEDYQVWIMAASIVPYTDVTPLPTIPSKPSIPTHLARVVVRMSTSTGALDYVDGTDILINVDGGLVDTSTWAETWVDVFMAK